MRKPSITRPSFTLRYSIWLSGPSTEHVFLVLIGIDRAIVDQDRRVLAARQQLHPGEQARRELPVLVGEYCACADRTGLRIELVVEEVDGARVRETFLVGEADTHWIRRVGRAVARARHLQVAQVALLIRVEIQVNRIERYDRREQGPAVVAAGDQIAARHFSAADASGDRARDPGEAQVERCRLERRLGSRYIGLGLGNRARALIELLLGDRAARLQPLDSHRFDAREFERRLVAFHIGGGAINFRLVGPRIDDEQQGTALDLAALRKGDLVDVSRNTRADFHGLHGLEPPRELVPIFDLLFQYRGHADLRGRSGLCLTA